MKKHPRPFPFLQGLLFGGTIATVVTTSLIASGFYTSVKAELENNPKTVVDEVWQVVQQEFVDRDFNQVNWQEVRQQLLSKNYNSQEEAYKEIRRSLKLLGDPYTRFLDPHQYEELTSQTSGEVTGVGIRIEVNETSKKLTIVQPIPHSPAEQAGLQAGDQILKINDQPTDGLTVDQSATALTGENGTSVKLTIHRVNKGIFDVTLTRTSIELPSVTYSLKREGNMRVGYIKLDEFSSHSPEQMKKAIQDLQSKQANVYLLDLRGNPGGLLLSSVEIARMWLETGAIVRTVDRRGGDQQFSANHTSITNLPLVVLVNEDSASASEILAGALKDNKRATLVGTRTFGKGTVQSVHSLSDGSGLAVTIAKYYTPSGVNITHKGIEPDIEQAIPSEQQIRLAMNPDLMATLSDPQYYKAISILQQDIASQQNHHIDPVSIR